jgi:hypothetical protein
MIGLDNTKQIVANGQLTASTFLHTRLVGQAEIVAALFMLGLVLRGLFYAIVIEHRGGAIERTVVTN